MAVDDLDGLVVGHTDMIGLDADDRAQLLVDLVDDEEPFTLSTYFEQPEV